MCDIALFLVNTYKTQRFEESFIGYSVVPSDIEVTCLLDRLLDYNIIQVLETVNGDYIVPLKYNLNDIIEQHILGCNPLHESFE